MQKIKKLLKIFLALFIIINISPALARPEIVREGLVYYSDNFVQNGSVKDIVGEKNIEEVYQFYTYYETAYDAAGRVVLFKEYKQGKVILEEHYTYDGDNNDGDNNDGDNNDGKSVAPKKRTTNEPNNSVEVIPNSTQH